MGFLDMFKKKQMKKTSVNKNVKVDKLPIKDKDTKINDLNNKIDDLIKKEILNVVQYHENFNELNARAKIAAYNIGEENVNLLPEYLYGKIDAPIELIYRYEKNEEWEMMVENSVLMIIFNYKQTGVNILTEIAYGDSKVRLKAINLLLRLAADGVCTESIVDDILNNIINFSDDEKIIIFGFASKLKGNNKIIALIQHFYKEFLKEGDIERAYQTLEYLINVAQRATSGHLNFLKLIAMGSEGIDLRKVIDIKDGEKEFINVGKLDDMIKIRAAITFYNINKEDDEINNILNYYSENYYNDEVKNEIERLLKNKE